MIQLLTEVVESHITFLHGRISYPYTDVLIPPLPICIPRVLLLFSKGKKNDNHPPYNFSSPFLPLNISDRIYSKLNEKFYLRLAIVTNSVYSEGN